MARYRITDIKYDASEITAAGLPDELIVDVDDGLDEEEVDEILSDEISDRTGFCHKGFVSEKVA